MADELVRPCLTRRRRTDGVVQAAGAACISVSHARNGPHLT